MTSSIFTEQYARFRELLRIIFALKSMAVYKA